MSNSSQDGLTEARPSSQSAPSPPPSTLDYVSTVYSNLTLAVMVPVSITIFIVVWGVINLTPIYAGRSESPLYLAADENSASSSAEKFGYSLLNALIIVLVIVAVTTLMVVLYKMRCMKVIAAWFILSSAMILFFLAWVWIDLVCVKYQIPYDYVGIAFFLWNFGVVGLISLFYIGHERIAQFYLVAISVVIAWILTRLAEWTTWTILVVVAIYDIIAVLWSRGPLKALVEEAQARNEPLPGFIYDTNSGAQATYTLRSEVESAPRLVPPPPIQDSSFDVPTEQPIHTVATNTQQSTPAHPLTGPAPEVPLAAAPSGDPTTSGATPAVAGGAPDADPDSHPQQQAAEEDEEDLDPFEAAQYAHPFKLGLGDFIFYSLLVGRAATYSYVSWVVCFVCVLMGLIGTLCSLLFLRGKIPALPALPISIFLAVIAFFLSRYTLVPYCYDMIGWGLSL